MSNPFRYFNSSPEVIRLLRNVEDLLAERGIDISHETLRILVEPVWQCQTKCAAGRYAR